MAHPTSKIEDLFDKLYCFIKVGITGSIGMGKTTIASEFGKFNYPIWNSDEVVHKLYKKENQGYNIIKALVPEAVGSNNVDREILSKNYLDIESFDFKDIINKYNLSNYIINIIKKEQDKKIKTLSKIYINNNYQIINAE